jgi:LSD1 subclass zinc finger protein
MMTRPDDENDPLRDAWNQAAARPHGAGSAKGLIKNADPDSCVGMMEHLLVRRGVVVTVCDHLRLSNGRGDWYATLEDPDRLVCPACVPQMYVNLLRRPPGAFRHRCACCGTVKLLSGVRKVSVPTRGGLGTVLGVLCRDCTTESTPGLVSVPW